jgi:MFS transporter, DHA1 family, staphyloferrin A biosynthesis exporter
LIETGAESTPRESAPTRIGFFASLRYRDSLILWITHLCSSTQFWMDMVARPWLVYEISDSVLLLGVVQALRGLPVIVFSGMGGILADRVDRTKLYAVVRWMNAASLIALTALLLAGRIEVWQILVLTVLSGIAGAMEFPIRQSLIPSAVPPHLLMNSIALNSVGRQLTHLLAPSVAGVLIATSGIAGAYVAQSSLALVAATLPLFLRIGPLARTAAHESVGANVVGAIRYVRANEIILTLLVLALAQRFFTGSYQTMFPVFAKDIYGAGEVGFGLLNSAIGAGAFLGALAIAVAGNVRRKGMWLLIGAALQGVGLILFAATPWFGLALVLTAVIGFVQTAYFTMNNTLLLARVSEEYRGRVIALYDMDRGLTPLGAILLSWIATVAGAPVAVAVMAAPMIPLMLFVLWRVPRFRDAE